MLTWISQEWCNKKIFSSLTWIFIFKPGNKILVKPRWEGRESGALGRVMVIAVVVLVFAGFYWEAEEPLCLSHSPSQSCKVKLCRWKSPQCAFFINICQWTEFVQHYFWTGVVMKWFFLDLGLKILVMCYTRKVMGFGVAWAWILILPTSDNYCLIWESYLWASFPQVQNEDNICTL